MDVELVTVNEVNQTKTIPYGMAYMWHQKNMVPMNILTKQKYIGIFKETLV